MYILENQLYLDEIKNITDFDFSWEKLQNKTILISGATGLIGSYFIDVIMKVNERFNLNCKVIALSRSKEKIEQRFKKYIKNENFKYIICDINNPINIYEKISIDYIMHLASNTHPLAYANYPIDTIKTNVFGAYNLLELASKCNAKRFLLASSCDIYGENRGDIERFKEDYCGYIDCNTLRAGYNESKRCYESLCQAYMQEKNIDIVIARIAHVYGPTMLMSDSKASSQFIKSALKKEDIVLKSKGCAFFSYIYVGDVVTGIIKLLLDGKCGEAYNIADESSEIKIKDLAEKIAKISKTKVVFKLPDKVEKEGYSKATKAILDISKISDLGWHPQFNIDSGIERTFKILQQLN